MPSKTATSKSAASAAKPGKGADRAKTIKRMIALREKGLGVNAIAAKLDEEGYPTFGSAKKWPHRVVYGVLLKELGASKMKLKAKPSKAAQTGTEKRVDPGKTPAKTEKLDNGDVKAITDVPGATLVKLGGDKKDVKPDPKPAARTAGRDVAKPTPTKRRTRKA
jgi:hypothetical protein